MKLHYANVSACSRLLDPHAKLVREDGARVRWRSDPAERAGRAEVERGLFGIACDLARAEPTRAVLGLRHRVHERTWKQSEPARIG